MSTVGFADLDRLLRRSARAAMLACAGLVLTAGGAAAQSTPEALLAKARYEEEIRGDVDAAIRIYRSIVDEHAGRRDLAARALLELAEAYEVLGREGARDAYARIVADYADQVEVAGVARSRLDALVQDGSPSAGSEAGFRMMRLWETPEEVGVGGLSPDGRYATFIDWGPLDDPATRGHADVAVWDTREASAKLVTDRPSLSVVDVYPSAPLWSKDGRWMAYSLWADGWTHMQLRIVRPDGTGDRPILDNRQFQNVQGMAFASDGSFVAALLQGWDDLYRIGIVGTDGELTVLKTLDDHRPTALGLSPDARWVAYDVEAADGSHELLALAVDGSAEVPIAPGPSDDVRAFWTPDGARVVFMSDRSGRAGLWTVGWSPGGPAGEPTLVHDGLGSMNLLGLTADGAPYFLAPTTRSEVYVAELDLEGRGSFGDVSRAPDTHLFTNLRPAWSPDGERIAWLSRRGPAGGGLHVVIEDVATGDEISHPLPFSGLFRETRVDWSADGRHLLFEGGSFTSRTSYRIDARTGEAERLEHIRDWAGIAGPQFRFVDGRQHAALRELGVRIIGQTDMDVYAEGDAVLRPGETLLWVRNGVQRVRSIADRDVEPLTPQGHMHAWSLSPDGRTLALAVAGDSVMVSNLLYVLPLDGGEARELVRLGRDVKADEPSVIHALQWSADGSRLIYATGTEAEGADVEIWTVPVDGGEPRRLDVALTAHQLGTLRFHPDGRRVAYDVSEWRAELWIAEGLPWQTSAGR